MAELQWTFKFKQLGSVEKPPPNAVQIAEEIQDDHLEQLWVDPLGTFYRYAGGGRGFYWTAVLELEECKEEHIFILKEE